MCGRDEGQRPGARGGGGNEQKGKGQKERGKEKRRRDKDEGGARVRRADNPNHRIRRMHPHGFAALRPRAGTHPRRANMPLAINRCPPS